MPVGNCTTSVGTVLRIRTALRITPGFWLNLRGAYDLERARGSTDVSQIEPLVPALSVIQPGESSD